MKENNITDEQKLKNGIAAIAAKKLPRKELVKSLKGLRWGLYNPQLGFWAGLAPLGNIVPTDDVECAQIFDGRDNETMKLAYYRAATGIHWQVRMV